MTRLKAGSGDAVDKILGQWARERPDLDASPMGPIGRLRRCSALMQRRLEETFSQFGLSAWEFDVLATLRRSGAPYCLAPTALFSTLMVTSGTMTHRMRGLETRALVQRLPNPEDARSVWVQLTPSGLALIDQAVEAHIENERQILSELSAAELSTLDRSLALLLVRLEPGAGEA
jgi:DNA-binding MarR family transcriptional regulator